MARARELLAGLDRWIFHAENARRLAGVRIGLCGLLAIRLAIGDYGHVAGQPAELFQPLSYMKLLDSMPSAGLTEAIQIAGVVLAIAAAAGLAIRITLPAALLAALFLNGMLNATGKVIHNDVLLILCLLPLLVAGSAACAAWSLPAWRRTDPPAPETPMPAPGAAIAFGWPIRTAMVVVALAYFFVGFQKLRFSGIEWATSENLRWVLYASSDSQSAPNELGLFVAERAWLAHALALGTLALELGFPLALLIPRLRWLFIPGVISLHVGIWLMMDLDYSAQWLTVVIVFVDWSRAADYVNARIRGPAQLQTAVRN